MALMTSGIVVDAADPRAGSVPSGTRAVDLAGAAAPAITGTASPSAGRIRVVYPPGARRGLLTAIRLTLPRSIGAIDGRVLMPRGAASLMGVAVYGAGTGLRPVAVQGGYAFGAYGLQPRHGVLVVDLVVLPDRNGRLDLRVIVDSVADRGGARTSVTTTAMSGTLRVGTDRSHRAASVAGPSPRPLRAAGPLVELLPDGRVDRRDVDVARAAWEEARATRRVCGPQTPADANGDGCTDAVDLQATLAAVGTRMQGELRRRRLADDPGTRTLTVTSPLDTPDAVIGDGTCADASGMCTLRAAIAEADRLPGDDRIVFALPGTAPVTIQLTGRLPLITARDGTLTINGYSQAGARPNSAQFRSDAIPGVVLRGNGPSAHESGLFITSPGNTVRGLAMVDLWRGIFIDGPNAYGNRIVGDWIGFDGSGTVQSSRGNYGVLLNVGAHDNIVGTPDPADRNVIGGWHAAVNHYGPRVERNVIQNDLLCIAPDGSAADCQIGVDYNFGPKDGLVGGDGESERVVIGPTGLQGVELSHGWDPKGAEGVDAGPTYQINGNRIIGNWIGFRADGSYAAEYRSGFRLLAYESDGINVFDGTNDNLIARNVIASIYNGIAVMSPISHGNIVRGNLIGESRLGEAAPLTGWGIVVRWGSHHDQLLGNTVRHADLGGVGLLDIDNTGGPLSVANNVRISRTIVTGTSGPAIYLAPDRVDPAQTANGSARPPVITSADNGHVLGTGVPGATVEVYLASRPAGGSGLPVETLGDATVGADGLWRVPVTVTGGDRVTALQILPDENTSALASNVLVGEAPPPPPPPDPEVRLGADDFGRVDPTGWGTADLGGAWTLSGGGFSVAGGEGRIVVAAGRTREARLPVGAADVDITGRLTLDRLPLAGNAHAYVLARADAARNAYRGTIRIGPNGSVFVQLRRYLAGVESNVAAEVATDLVLVPGEPLRFRFAVSGDQLRLRVWRGADEPAGWQTSANDTALAAAGAAGLTVYAGRSMTNAPVTFSLDAFEVRP
jgi:hypothetical protein